MDTHSSLTSLTKSRTQWILFLSCSSIDPEVRHIYDLVFGLLCLERSGIPPADIKIYVDGQSRSVIQNLFSIGSTHPYVIKPSAELFNDLKSNGYENLVMFVSGHGSERGIDAVPPVSPSMLLDSIKTAPSLERAVVYLGQCFAGVFNYINAGRGRRSGKADPDVIFIGATNLHESLSSSTSEMFLTGSVPWVANLFLLHVFRWILSPQDIDGDGRFTIMDSYKYAGVMSNRSFKATKTNSFGLMVDYHERHKQALHAVNNPTGNPQVDMQTQITYLSILQIYSNLLNVNYVHQECWILNSYPAQDIVI